MTPNTVLVIENESTTVTMVERSLQNEGYTMYNAVDADSGLQMAREVVPSIIMLNLAVDGANGLEICKTIHSDEALKDVPLILLTLREGKFDPIYTKLYGIVNFLKKPFTPEQLLENVREFAPFQPGAAAPAPKPAAPQPAMEEVPEESFSPMEEPEQEPSYGAMEEEPAYGGIDEPMEPASAFSGADESMEDMSEGGMDDDVYSLDEDVSLEDAQAGLESEDDLAGGFSAETFQQDIQMAPEDDDILTEDEDSFQMLGDAEVSSPDMDMGAMEEPVSDLEMEEPIADFEEDSFDLPEVDETPSPMQSPPAEDEIPDDGPGLTLDGMGFDEPSEDIEPIKFEMPEPEDEEEAPKPKKRVRPAAAPVKKGKEPKAPKAKKVKEPKRRPTSSVNRPKGKRSLVLVLLLLLVLVLAGGASYYFFIYQPGMPTQMAKATKPVPAPEQTASADQPTPVPAPATPGQPTEVPPPGVQPQQATPGAIPPPSGVTPAPVEPPKPVPAPAPVVTAPAPAPTPTPKPVVAPKPPPPRPPAPTQTAQTVGNVPAGSKYTVQFGVFSTEKSALSLIVRLKKKGLKVYIKPRKSSTGKFFYYVLLEGGFKTKDAASDKASEIQRTKGFDTTVHAL